MPSVDFATFCHSGDAHRLHVPGQLKRQVESNGYPFNEVIVIHQLCTPTFFRDCNFSVNIYAIDDLDQVLRTFYIDLDKPQYVSEIDKAHTWKNHTANHLAAVMRSGAEYIVFADNDCWIVRQPSGTLFDSWVNKGIEILSTNPEIFIVSPNDGEPERKTQVISQQMFMARTEEFRNADFNQPGYSGNPGDYPEMPEYHAMMEGRIHHYCKATGKYRYVLYPEYRYFHHNRFNEDGTYKMNYSDYGI